MINIMRETLPTEAYYKMCSVYFLFEGEDPGYYNYDIGKEKIDIFKSMNPKDRVFFWNILSGILKSLGLNLNSDIPNFLSRQTEKMNTYKTVIEQLKKKDLV